MLINKYILQPSIKNFEIRKKSFPALPIIDWAFINSRLS